jgi:hypothetical protein
MSIWAVSANETAPQLEIPIAPPVTPTYAYVYINYAIVGVNSLIALFAIFTLIRQLRQKSGFDAPALLYIHVVLFMISTFRACGIMITGAFRFEAEFYWPNLKRQAWSCFARFR